MTVSGMLSAASIGTSSASTSANRGRARSLTLASTAFTWSADNVPSMAAASVTGSDRRRRAWFTKDPAVAPDWRA